MDDDDRVFEGDRVLADNDDRILRRLLDLEYRLNVLDKDGHLDTENLEESIRRSFNAVYREFDGLKSKVERWDGLIDAMREDLDNAKKIERNLSYRITDALADDIKVVRYGLRWWQESAEARFGAIQQLLLRETTAIGILIGEMRSERSKQMSRIKWSLIFIIIINGITLLEIIKMRNGIR